MASCSASLSGVGGADRRREFSQLDAVPLPSPLRIKLEPSESGLVDQADTSTGVLRINEFSDNNGINDVVLSELNNDYSGTSDNNNFSGANPRNSLRENQRDSSRSQHNLDAKPISSLEASEIIKQLTLINNRIHNIHDLAIINKHNIDKIMDHLNAG